MEKTRGEMLLISWKGIQQHACHCEHACDPTILAHLPRRRQEASPTGAEHAF